MSKLKLPTNVNHFKLELAGALANFERRENPRLIHAYAAQPCTQLPTALDNILQLNARLLCQPANLLAAVQLASS